MTAPVAVGVTARVPEAGSEPDQPPLAVQVEPALDDQVSVALWPSTMLVGETEMETVGGGGELPPPP